jgi:hypothetical protein
LENTVRPPADGTEAGNALLRRSPVWGMGGDALIEPLLGTLTRFPAGLEAEAELDVAPESRR